MCCDSGSKDNKLILKKKTSKPHSKQLFANFMEKKYSDHSRLSSILREKNEKKKSLTFTLAFPSTLEALLELVLEDLLLELPELDSGDVDLDRSSSSSFSACMFAKIAPTPINPMTSLRSCFGLDFFCAGSGAAPLPTSTVWTGDALAGGESAAAGITPANRFGSKRDEDF